jgi:hypothetical protein
MPRFTIRDVLWLTVVVALGVGWWVEHSRLTGRLQESQAALEKTQSERNTARSMVSELMTMLTDSGGWPKRLTPTTPAPPPVGVIGPPGPPIRP